MVFKTRINRLFLCPDIEKNTEKYPVTGRRGSEDYAIYRAGSGAKSETDGLIDLPENLRAIRTCAFFQQHLHHKKP